MPQVELKYTSDLKLATLEIFEVIEQTIHELDPASGACKSRGIKIQEYRHSHVFLQIYMLKKIHRDDAFTQSLLKKIQQNINLYLPAKNICDLSILLEYQMLDVNYLIR